MTQKLKHEDTETKQDYVMKELKRVDESLSIFDEVIDLIDLFDFYDIIDRVNKNVEAYKLKNNFRINQATKQMYVYEELMNHCLKYCAIYCDCLYVKCKNQWKQICDHPIKKFNLLINTLFRKFIDFNQQDQFNKKVIDFIQIDTQNSIIQFKNYYIEKGLIKEGVYQHSLPTYQIDREIQDDFSINLNEPVEELLLHLSENDEATKARLIDDLSMCICNDSQFIRRNGKFIRFYGPTANNGKSTLLNILQLTLGDQNVTSFNTSQLKKYELEYVTKCLVAFDPDEEGSRWSAEVSRNIKTVVTADQLLVRQIYSRPIRITPITTLIAATNNMPKSEDKSAGISRRLDWFYIKAKLKKDDDWFTRLYSDESAQYFMNRLFYNYKDLLDRGQLVERSEKMAEVEKMFNEENNSAYSFALATSLDDILNHTVKDVKGQYEEYCETNDLNVLGGSKFNHEIATHFGLKIYPIQYEKVELGSHHAKSVIDYLDQPKKQVKAWIKE